MTTDHPRTTLSPREAARISGVGRSSIMRALSSGQLEARRDNHNDWQIDRDALDRWIAARRGQARTMSEDHPADHPADHTRTLEELAAATATISQLEARLTAAEQDRDRWQAMAEKLADRPTVTPPPARRRRWWPWQ